MKLDMAKLRELYGSLLGIREALAESYQLFVKMLGDTYSAVVQDLAKVLHTDLSRYELPKEVYDEYSGKEARKTFLECKLFPLISSLEFKYHLNEEIVEIGSLYGSLDDEELHGRCADILSARGHFDRVVNQATMVFEDRIRQKRRGSSSKTGTQLVNDSIKAKVEDSEIVISSEPDEQEGFSNIFRGVMLAFRNTTHHTTSEVWTREDALKVCAFVDYLLKRLEGARVRT